MTAKPSKGQRHPKLTFAEQPTWKTFSVATAFSFQNSHSAVASPGNNLLLLQIHTVFLDIVVEMTLIPDDLISHMFIIILLLLFIVIVVVIIIVMFKILFWGECLTRGLLFGLSLPKSSLGLTIPSGSPLAYAQGRHFFIAMTTFPPAQSFRQMLEDYELEATKSGNFFLVYMDQTFGFYSAPPVAESESMQASEKSMISPFILLSFYQLLAPQQNKYK